jgi:hypothetical protein
MKSCSKNNRLIGVLTLLTCMSLVHQKNSNAECPCDIYEAGGTPCVGAFSMVRLLSSDYDGPLYQVRRSDGQTKDIPQDEDGFADASVQDEFLGNSGGTVSKLYDQSGKGNDLTVAKKGCYSGTASQDDRESDAKGRKVLVGGHNVYGLFMKQQEGYRSNQEGYSGYPDRVDPANGMATGNKSQGIYEVCDGKRYGTACCWNFGNGSTNNCYGPTGQMNTLFFGTAYWGRGAGNGPWFMNDMEAGVWAGGSKPGEPGWGALDDAHPPNPNNPSITWNYAFGISKASTENNQPKYCLRMGNAQSGDLTTAWDGNAPTTWKMEGGILLGIGGDNSNSSYGTFFEGCITFGRPSDETDERVFENVQNIGYGSDKVATTFTRVKGVPQSSLFKVGYNPSNAQAVINYYLQKARHVNMNVFDQQGRRVAVINSGMKAAGEHKLFWDARQQPSGVYVAQVMLDGRNGWAEKIIVGK